jgi:hypothetical protein
MDYADRNRSAGGGSGEGIQQLGADAVSNTNILGRLGCLGCHSGIDIRFVVEENFAGDEKSEGDLGSFCSRRF